jgi:Zeta toxin
MPAYQPLEQFATSSANAFVQDVQNNYYIPGESVDVSARIQEAAQAANKQLQDALKPLDVILTKEDIDKNPKLFDLIPQDKKSILPDQSFQVTLPTASARELALDFPNTTFANSEFNRAKVIDAFDPNKYKELLQNNEGIKNSPVFSTIKFNPDERLDLIVAKSENAAIDREDMSTKVDLNQVTNIKPQTLGKFDFQIQNFDTSKIPEITQSQKDYSFVPNIPLDKEAQVNILKGIPIKYDSIAPSSLSAQDLEIANTHSGYLNALKGGNQEVINRFKDNYNNNFGKGSERLQTNYDALSNSYVVNNKLEIKFNPSQGEFGIYSAKPVMDANKKALENIDNNKGGLQTAIDVIGTEASLLVGGFFGENTVLGTVTQGAQRKAGESAQIAPKVAAVSNVASSLLRVVGDLAILGGSVVYRTAEFKYNEANKIDDTKYADRWIKGLSLDANAFWDKQKDTFGVQGKLLAEATQTNNQNYGELFGDLFTGKFGELGNDINNVQNNTAFNKFLATPIYSSGFTDSAIDRTVAGLEKETGGVRTAADVFFGSAPEDKKASLKGLSDMAAIVITSLATEGLGTLTKTAKVAGGVESTALSTATKGFNIAEDIAQTTEAKAIFNRSLLGVVPETLISFNQETGKIITKADGTKDVQVTNGGQLIGNITNSFVNLQAGNVLSKALIGKINEKLPTIWANTLQSNVAGKLSTKTTKTLEEGGYAASLSPQMRKLVGEGLQGIQNLQETTIQSGAARLGLNLLDKTSQAASFIGSNIAATILQESIAAGLENKAANTDAGKLIKDNLVLGLVLLTKPKEMFSQNPEIKNAVFDKFINKIAEGDGGQSLFYNAADIGKFLDKSKNTVKDFRSGIDTGAPDAKAYLFSENGQTKGMYGDRYFQNQDGLPILAGSKQAEFLDYIQNRIAIDQSNGLVGEVTVSQRLTKDVFDKDKITGGAIASILADPYGEHRIMVVEYNKGVLEPQINNQKNKTKTEVKSKAEPVLVDKEIFVIQDVKDSSGNKVIGQDGKVDTVIIPLKDIIEAKEQSPIESSASVLNAAGKAHSAVGNAFATYKDRQGQNVVLQEIKEGDNKGKYIVVDATNGTSSIINKEQAVQYTKLNPEEIKAQQEVDKIVLDKANADLISHGAANGQIITQQTIDQTTKVAVEIATEKPKQTEPTENLEKIKDQRNDAAQLVYESQQATSPKPSDAKTFRVAKVGDTAQSPKTTTNQPNVSYANELTRVAAGELMQQVKKINPEITDDQRYSLYSTVLGREVKSSKDLTEKELDIIKKAIVEDSELVPQSDLFGGEIRIQPKETKLEQDALIGGGDTSNGTVAKRKQTVLKSDKKNKDLGQESVFDKIETKELPIGEETKKSPIELTPLEKKFEETYNLSPELELRAYFRDNPVAEQKLKDFVDKNQSNFDFVKKYGKFTLELKDEAKNFFEKKYNPDNSPVIIDPDLLKEKYNDYDTNNHHIYSTLSKIDYAIALKYNNDPSVVFTAGGSGSGKSEGIVNLLIESRFKGIIMDGTFANLKENQKKLDLALSLGKTVQVRGILPDMVVAWKFVQKRAIEKKRDVPAEVFLEKHRGFVESFGKAIGLYPQVKFTLIDNTNDNNNEILTYKNKILDKLQNLRYNDITIENNKLNYDKNLQLSNSKATDSSRPTSSNADVRGYRDGLEKSQDSRDDKSNREQSKIQGTSRDVSKTETANSPKSSQLNDQTPTQTQTNRSSDLTTNTGGGNKDVTSDKSIRETTASNSNSNVQDGKQSDTQSITESKTDGKSEIGSGDLTVGGEPSVSSEFRDVTKEQVSPTTEPSTRQGDSTSNAKGNFADRQPNTNDVERSVRSGDATTVDYKKQLEKQIDKLAGAGNPYQGTQKRLYSIEKTVVNLLKDIAVNKLNDPLELYYLLTNTLGQNYFDVLKQYTKSSTEALNGDEYFTPKVVTQLIWSLVKKHIKLDDNTKILETSAGTGNFLDFAPKSRNVDYFELNPFSALITKMLYGANWKQTATGKGVVEPILNDPTKYSTNQGLIINDLGYKNTDGKYDLVIGNPPYSPSLLKEFTKNAVKDLADGGILAWVAPFDAPGGSKYDQTNIDRYVEAIYPPSEYNVGYEYKVLENVQMPVEIFEKNLDNNLNHRPAQPNTNVFLIQKTKLEKSDYRYKMAEQLKLGLQKQDSLYSESKTISGQFGNTRTVSTVGEKMSNEEFAKDLDQKLDDKFYNNSVAKQNETYYIGQTNAKLNNFVVDNVLDASRIFDLADSSPYLKKFEFELTPTANIVTKINEKAKIANPKFDVSKIIPQKVSVGFTAAVLDAPSQSLAELNPNIDPREFEIYNSPDLEDKIYKGKDAPKLYKDGFLAMAQENVYVPNLYYYAGNVFEKLSSLEELNKGGKIDKTGYINQKEKLEAMVPVSFKIDSNISNEHYEFSVTRNYELLSQYNVEYAGKEMPLTEAITQGVENFRDTLKTNINSPVLELSQFNEENGILSLLKVDSPEYITAVDAMQKLQKQNIVIKNTENSLVDIALKNNRVEIRRGYGEKLKEEFAKSSSDASLESRKAIVSQELKTIGQVITDQVIRKYLSSKQKKEVEKYLNETYINVPINYEKLPILAQLPKMYNGKTMDLRNVQRRSIGFADQNKGGMIALDAGGGKTLSVIVAIEQMMQAGKSNRPFVAVPNQMTAQFWKEIRQVLPHRNILNLGGLTQPDIARLTKEGFIDGRGQFDTSKIPENTIIYGNRSVIDHFAFNGAVKDSVSSLLKDIMDINESEAGGSKTKAAVDKAREATQKKLAKAQAFLTSSTDIKTIGTKTSKPYIFDFDAAGIDLIVADEAHDLSNVFTSITYKDQNQKKEQKGKSSMERVAGLSGSGSPNSQAMKFYLASKHIQNKGGSTILMTATPLENRIQELFTLLSISSEATLNKYGVNNIYDFVDTFVDVGLDDKTGIDGRLNSGGKLIVKGFKNQAVFQSMMGEAMLYVSGDQMGVMKPYANKQYPVVKLTELQSYIQNYDKEGEGTTSVEKIIKNLVKEYIKAKIEVKPGKDTGANSQLLAEAGRKLNILKDNVLSPVLVLASVYNKSSTSGLWDQLGIEDPKLLKTIQELSSETAEVEYDEDGNEIKTKKAKSNVFSNDTLETFYNNTPSVQLLVSQIKNKYERYGKGEGREITDDGISGLFVYNEREASHQLIGQTLLKYAVDKNNKPLLDKNDVVYISGKSTSDGKNTAKERFNSAPVDEEGKTIGTRAKILLGSKTAQTGLDLQKSADTTYIMTLPWNYTEIVQLVARVTRFGSEYESNNVIIPVTENSAIPHVLSILAMKENRNKSLFEVDKTRTMYQGAGEKKPMSEMEIVTYSSRNLKDIVKAEITKESQSIKGEENSIKLNIDSLLKDIDKSKYSEQRMASTVDEFVTFAKVLDRTREINFDKVSDDRVIEIYKDVVASINNFAQKDMMIKGKYLDFSGLTLGGAIDDYFKNIESNIDPEIAKQSAVIKTKLKELLSNIPNQLDQLKNIDSTDKNLFKTVENLDIYKDNDTSKWFSDLSSILGNKEGYSLNYQREQNQIKDLLGSKGVAQWFKSTDSKGKDVVSGTLKNVAQYVQKQYPDGVEQFDKDTTEKINKLEEREQEINKKVEKLDEAIKNIEQDDILNPNYATDEATKMVHEKALEIQAIRDLAAVKFDNIDDVTNNLLEQVQGKGLPINKGMYDVLKNIQQYSVKNYDTPLPESKNYIEKALQDYFTKTESANIQKSDIGTIFADYLQFGQNTLTSDRNSQKKQKLLDRIKDAYKENAGVQNSIDNIIKQSDPQTQATISKLLDIPIDKTNQLNQNTSTNGNATTKQSDTLNSFSNSRGDERRQNQNGQNAINDGYQWLVAKGDGSAERYRQIEAIQMEISSNKRGAIGNTRTGNGAITAPKTGRIKNGRKDEGGIQTSKTLYTPGAYANTIDKLQTTNQNTSNLNTNTNDSSTKYPQDQSRSIRGNLQGDLTTDNATGADQTRQSPQSSTSSGRVLEANRQALIQHLESIPTEQSSNQPESRTNGGRVYLRTRPQYPTGDVLGGQGALPKVGKSEVGQASPSNTAGDRNKTVLLEQLSKLGDSILVDIASSLFDIAPEYVANRLEKIEQFKGKDDELGYYIPGAKKILINQNLFTPDLIHAAREVLVHEIAHVLFDQNAWDKYSEVLQKDFSSFRKVLETLNSQLPPEKLKSTFLQYINQGLLGHLRAFHKLDPINYGREADVLYAAKTELESLEFGSEQFDATAQELYNYLAPEGKGYLVNELFAHNVQLAYRNKDYDTVAQYLVGDKKPINIYSDRAIQMALGEVPNLPPELQTFGKDLARSKFVDGKDKANIVKRSMTKELGNSIIEYGLENDRPDVIEAMQEYVANNNLEKLPEKGLTKLTEVLDKVGLEKLGAGVGTMQEVLTGTMKTSGFIAEDKTTNKFSETSREMANNITSTLMGLTSLSGNLYSIFDTASPISRKSLVKINQLKIGYDAILSNTVKSPEYKQYTKDLLSLGSYGNGVMSYYSNIWTYKRPDMQSGWALTGEKYLGKLKTDEKKQEFLKDEALGWITGFAKGLVSFQDKGFGELVGPAKVLAIPKDKWQDFGVDQDQNLTTDSNVLSQSIAKLKTDIEDFKRPAVDIFKDLVNLADVLVGESQKATGVAQEVFDKNMKLLEPMVKNYQTLSLNSQDQIRELLGENKIGVDPLRNGTYTLGNTLVKEENKGDNGLDTKVDKFVPSDDERIYDHKLVATEDYTQFQPGKDKEPFVIAQIIESLNTQIKSRAYTMLLDAERITDKMQALANEKNSVEARQFRTSPLGMINSTIGNFRKNLNNENTFTKTVERYAGWAINPLMGYTIASNGAAFVFAQTQAVVDTLKIVGSDDLGLSPVQVGLFTAKVVKQIATLGLLKKTPQFAQVELSQRGDNLKTESALRSYSDKLKVNDNLRNSKKLSVKTPGALLKVAGLPLGIAPKLAGKAIQYADVAVNKAVVGLLVEMIESSPKNFTEDEKNLLVAKYLIGVNGEKNVGLAHTKNNRSPFEAFTSTLRDIVGLGISQGNLRRATEEIYKLLNMSYDNFGRGEKVQFNFTQKDGVKVDIANQKRSQNMAIVVLGLILSGLLGGLFQAAKNYGQKQEKPDFLSPKGIGSILGGMDDSVSGLVRSIVLPTWIGAQNYDKAIKIIQGLVTGGGSNFDESMSKLNSLVANVFGQGYVYNVAGLLSGVYNTEKADVKSNVKDALFGSLRDQVKYKDGKVLPWDVALQQLFNRDQSPSSVKKPDYLGDLKTLQRDIELNKDNQGMKASSPEYNILQAVRDGKITPEKAKADLEQIKIDDAKDQLKAINNNIAKSGGDQAIKAVELKKLDALEEQNKANPEVMKKAYEYLQTSKETIGSQVAQEKKGVVSTKEAYTKDQAISETVGKLETKAERAAAYRDGTKIPKKTRSGGKLKLAGSSRSKSSKGFKIKKTKIKAIKTIKIKKPKTLKLARR